MERPGLPGVGFSAILALAGRAAHLEAVRPPCRLPKAEGTIHSSHLPRRSIGSALLQWFLWVALSTAGFAIGIAVGFPFNFLGGIPYGAAQWLVLRPLRGLRLWTLVTAWAYPFLLVGIVVYTGLAATLVRDPHRSFAPTAWLVALLLALATAPMAFAQWLLLYRHFYRAAIWIPASIAGWAFAAILLALGDGQLAAHGSPSWFSLLGNELPGRLGIAPLAAIQASVTGAALLILRPRDRPVETDMPWHRALSPLPHSLALMVLALLAMALLLLTLAVQPIAFKLLLAVPGVALLLLVLCSSFNRPRLGTALSLATILGAFTLAIALEFRSSAICQAQFEARHPGELFSNCYEFAGSSFLAFTCSALILAGIFTLLSLLLSAASRDTSPPDRPGA